MDSQPINLNTIRSKIVELTNFLQNPGDNPIISALESEKLLQDCVTAFEGKVNGVVLDHAEVGSLNDEDLDAYLERLRAELRETEDESASISKEVESLEKSYVEGTCQLESNLEFLRHVVECAEPEGLVQTKTGQHVDIYREREDYQMLAKAHHDDCFEIMKLKQQIEMNETTLKSLQDLDLNLKRIEAIEKVEEELTGLKVIDFEENTIRVSLKTYIPEVEGLIPQRKAEGNTKLSEVNHELLIEVMDGTTELKCVEIFPNDVYIAEIAEAANTFSKLFSVLSVQETRSNLGWFLQKVQDKIVLCTLRQLVVKIANSSRHSFEYFDKDESIIAHMPGGIDAFLKPSQGWPISDSALKLVSFRSSDQNMKEISLSLLSRVEEVANSLDLNTRKSITNFVDGIEEILLEKMRLELH